MQKVFDAKPKRSSQTVNADTITAALSMAVHEHRIAPGSKLAEGELAEIYGVSRTVIRSALQALAHAQLVEIKKNRGAFVAQPTLIEAHEVFEARELLEPRTARSAARLSRPDDIDRLKRHIENEHLAMDAGDQGLALSLSGQFHIEIARIAGQATIQAFIETLIARSSLIIAIYWRRESALCESHAHDALIRAIEQNDCQQAEELMHSHLVDLHSALDLREKANVARSLREALIP
ncbi:MAG: GntR family transcriptional regulator [Roseobacter sp.]